MGEGFKFFVYSLGKCDRFVLFLLFFVKVGCAFVHDLYAFGPLGSPFFVVNKFVLLIKKM